MKKTIFSFAIVAIVAVTTIAMTSCRNKANKAVDGETTEQVAEEEDSNALSTDVFSMSIPEDFEINGNPDTLKKNKQICICTKTGVVPAYEFKILHQPDITFDARQSDIAKLKTIAPIKLSNVTFQGGWQPDGKSLVLYADLGENGTAQIFMPKPSGAGGEKYDLDDAAIVDKLYDLLSCLKFK